MPRVPDRPQATLHGIIDEGVEGFEDIRRVFEELPEFSGWQIRRILGKPLIDLPAVRRIGVFAGLKYPTLPPEIDQ